MNHYEIWCNHENSAHDMKIVNEVVDLRAGLYRDFRDRATSE